MFRKVQKILWISLMLIMLMSVACYAEDIPEAETIELTSADEPSVIAAPPQEEKNAETEPATVDNATSAETTGNAEEEEMLSDDLYLIDSSINYTRTVDGNAYIMGNDITFGSMIGGDVYILGNNVTISNSAFIYGNLYVLANNLKLDGYVYGGDLYVACSEFTMSSSSIVNRDIRITSNKASFSGAVGRNVYASAKQITMDDSTNILGDFNYSSPEAIQVPSGAVQGKINYDESKVNTENSNPILGYLISLVQFVVLVLAIFGIVVLIAPKFLKKIENVEAKSILPSLGFGLIGLIVTIPVAILLLISVVATSVSFALISAWSLLAFIIATPIAIISIAGMLANKVEALKKAHNIIAVVIVSLVAWAVEFIPYVGGIISLLLLVYGLGLLITTVWKSRKEE